MEAPQSTDSLGVSDEQLFDRICPGEDLQGKAEKSVCSRIELLFVPGRGRDVPDWGDAGGYWKLEF